MLLSSPDRSREVVRDEAMRWDMASSDSSRCMKEYDISTDGQISREEWSRVEAHFFNEVCGYLGCLRASSGLGLDPRTRRRSGDSEGARTLHEQGKGLF